MQRFAKRYAPVMLAFVFVAAFAAAQVTRATLTGTVTDPSGAIVPNARIVITNQETGAKTVVKSNSAGAYTVPFLAPGRYMESVSQQGFKTYVHTGITLQTEQTLTENVVLQIGSASETVTVHAASPLIDTSDASTGESLTATQVEDLPSNGRAPLGFAHLEYGAVAKGKHSMTQMRPFDNSAADDFSLGGGNSSSNELLLDGVPNMQNSGRTAGFSPELDSVQSVHVDNFSANAALGDTSGGVVNITTKAGTNQFHGSASEYYNGSRPFQARPYFTSPTAKITSTHYNQYGGTIGGPVLIPHLVHGRNKLFFFYAYEGYRGDSPATTITSVPTQAERSGDFSALPDQLYDPFGGCTETTTTIGTKTYTYCQRNAIPGNILSNANDPQLTVNPISAAYLKLIPLPNLTGAADGEDNYFAFDPTTQKYESNMGRVDYNISDSDKIFFEAHRSRFDNSQGNIFNNALSGTSSAVILWGGEVDNVKTFSPTLNLETRLGFSRYGTFSGPNSLGTSPSSLGFPGYMSSNSTAPAIPYLTLSDSTSMPSLSAEPGNTDYFDDIQFYADLSKTWGKHTFQIGPDIRVNKNSSLSPGAADGAFAFNSSNKDFVTGSPDGPAVDSATGAKQSFGGALALFELGLPNGTYKSANYTIGTKFQYDNWYMGFFAQDDWKMAPNFTLSMGVRIEHETPVVESNNQMVAGWNPTMTNGVTAAAEQAYNAGTPSPYVSAKAFQPTGGVIYASSGNRSAYYPAAAYFSPRIGFAYAPGFAHGTLAIRGGAGIYVNPFDDYDAGQSYGFSQNSTMLFSTDNGFTPATTLSDPFPSGSTSSNYNPIQLPLGSSLGINTNLGSSIYFFHPVKVPFSEKWSLDVQKEFAHNWVVELGYMGAVQVHNSFSNDLSSVPLVPYLVHAAKGNDPAVAAISSSMSATVANPFYGTMAGYGPAATSALNVQSKISNSGLLHAYPEYSDVVEALNPNVRVNYNALLAQVTKRMSNGLEFTFNFQYSRQLGNTVQLNHGGPLSYEETTSDFPVHGSIFTLYQLPFGHGRQFNINSRLLDEVAGGWEVTGIYQYLSGTALSWGNVVYTGDWHDFHNNPHKPYYEGPSFNTSVFDTAKNDQPGSWNYRTFPQYVLRGDPTNNFDFSVLKDFAIGERVVIQPRVDAFNALNHPQFAATGNVKPTASTFGEVNKQLNSGRSLQGGIHIIF
ncbi:MAG TPA: carboxypeptidase regulatory-like domain-containing protein [Terracidiphilus sp.]|nr:carboxypeptidase regulatory-like domain-containing protein [Terracidiphilus sp.]